MNPNENKNSSDENKHAERPHASKTSSANKVFRLTIVRHGQTNHNRLRLLQGQMDTQLNRFGREQASLLSRYFKRVNIHFDHVYSSDLTRAYETSKIICAGNANKRPISITLNSLLRERSYGTLQGLPINVVRELAKLACCKPPAHVVTHPSWGPTSKIYRPDGGETTDEVRARVEAFCDHWLLPNVRDQERVLIVSHGGAIREFMRIFKHRYGTALRVQDMTMTPNTGVNEFDVWFDDRQKIAHVCANYLHNLPHLTFDVFNRDNPNANLNNLHLRRANQNHLKETEKNQDLKKQQQDQLATTSQSDEPTTEDTIFNQQQQLQDQCEEDSGGEGNKTIDHL